jgi:hypothetical protein
LDAPPNAEKIPLFQNAVPIILIDGDGLILSLLPGFQQLLQPLAIRFYLLLHLFDCQAFGHLEEAAENARSLADWPKWVKLAGRRQAAGGIRRAGIRYTS